jgi:hypothetical protein
MTPIDINKRVEQYVKLRDEIKRLDDAHKNATALHRETLEQLNSALLAHLNLIGGDSVRTESGTVYKTEKKSATLADRSAFWAHVVTSGEWDLLDWKAKATTVAEYIEKHNTLPPGVNFNVTHVVGVRRS